MMKFLEIAFCKEVFVRAALTGLVVGTLLAFINHADVLMSGQITTNVIFKILITYFVPYAVSTFSSVNAILVREKD